MSQNNQKTMYKSSKIKRKNCTFCKISTGYSVLKQKYGGKNCYFFITKINETYSNKKILRKNVTLRLRGNFENYEIEELKTIVLKRTLCDEFYFNVA